MGLDSFKSDDGVEDSVEIEDTELKRVFPTVRLIDNQNIVEGLSEYKEQHIPDYFWECPATSSSKYHHPISRKPHGLWAHTLMGATALEEHKWTYKEMGWVSQYELNCARAAILIHDTQKYGLNWWDGKSADRDHDLQAADRARKVDELPDVVSDCIETHMGPSYAGPDPRNHLELMVHNADMSASTPNISPKIWKPPEEIVEMNPELEKANDLRR